MPKQRNKDTYPGERYIDFKHNTIIDSSLDADGFFACGNREKRAQQLFKEVERFCRVAYTDGVPIAHIGRFRASCLELAQELEELERITQAYSAGQSETGQPCMTAEQTPPYGV